MQEKIKQLLEEVNAFQVSIEDDLESFKRKFTNKKGEINQLFGEFKALPGDQKKLVGQTLNQLKTRATERLNEFQASLKAQSVSSDRPHDLTLPGDAHVQGARHPLTTVLNRIVSIFERLGFTVAEGPEIEDDWHNFSALNFPDNHPARDMQDTFFVQRNPDYLLRTHTSSVQVRVMEDSEPPIKVLSPGRVYRNEAISARAHCFFHQVEGLVIDKGISFADMKQTLQYFSSEIFGDQARIKLRPSYFPFTEISAEMDVYWGLETEDDYRITKGTGWVEIMGCGMVDPNVLRNCGIDPEVYSGYAFGMGVERIAQLLYRVPDLRLYSQNDIRFLKQFERIG
ncbi:phenylalanine--tRNA ligase subunit alpha [Pontibacter sp. G13]|uniref:phenylalanine--tRNA ligase subunit alpha n=1 Tax=Pontibacter sp. G13 TaxID=3074898 RepID=UPI00288A5E7F|nr:phenylalanine--tRNA ligase subunit alpha [Pontibacter sp. G13]WNJ16051.1 phenylalanine--tRNA ligase subunit alpha [Pontibacter sp. G13]